MAQSLNTRADITTDAICYLGLPKYGKIMVGDKALEFFNDRTPEDNMQFPWASLQRAEAHVSRRGHIEKNFYLVLNNGHKIRFSSNDSGKILKVIRDQIGNDRVIRTATLGSVLKNVFKRNK